MKSTQKQVKVTKKRSSVRIKLGVRAGGQTTHPNHNATRLRVR
jgi:hypothetical protein